jgi:hypothetical protein
VCSGASIVLVILWFFVSILNVRAVLQGEILWPGKDEDMEDVSGHGHDSEED